MKEALYYERLENNIARCILCPHNCIIKNNSTGICKVRKNINGKLFSLVYKKTISICIDPIEKKPLFHFLPRTKTLSIGTIGCNLGCLHCQNFNISQITDESMFDDLKEFEYEDIIDVAIDNGCKSISYTYNEPTISIETILELSALAKKAGLKNILVTNGYINEEPLKKLLNTIDAVNIDLKSFDDGFYNKICGAKLAPVLKTIGICSKKAHIEITCLVIEGKNDSAEDMEKMVEFISDINKNTPLHLSKFHPMYKMKDTPTTKEQTLVSLKKIADKRLNHVYLGNVSFDNEIICPNCKKNNINHGKCLNCNKDIYGLF